MSLSGSIMASKDIHILISESVNVLCYMAKGIKFGNESEVADQQNLK